MRCSVKVTTADFKLKLSNVTDSELIFSNVTLSCFSLASDWLVTSTQCNEKKKRKHADQPTTAEIYKAKMYGKSYRFKFQIDS